MTVIRPAHPVERDAVVDTLASAFGDDPMFRWIAGAGPLTRSSQAARAVPRHDRRRIPQGQPLVFTTNDYLGAATVSDITVDTIGSIDG